MSKFNLAISRFFQAKKHIGSIAAAKLALAYLVSGELSLRPDNSWPKLYVRAQTEDPAMFLAFVAKHKKHARDLARLGKPETIIDVGANVGFFTALMAQEFPQARILSIEPDDANYVQLCKNVSQYANVTTIKAAIWPRDEPLQFTDATASSIDLRVESASGATGLCDNVIVGKKVSDVMHEYHIDQIDLIKIDIEGGESQLFSENTEWLHQTKQLFIEMHGNAWRSVFDCITLFDYECRDTDLGGLLITLKDMRGT